MNGRAYDYNLGRFLSVDPFIQEPGNSQSMNPYSYILNNPLSGTDPTGYKRCEDGKSGCAAGFGWTTVYKRGDSKGISIALKNGAKVNVNSNALNNKDISKAIEDIDLKDVESISIYDSPDIVGGNGVISVSGGTKVKTSGKAWVTDVVYDKDLSLETLDSLESHWNDMYSKDEVSGLDWLTATDKIWDAQGEHFKRRQQIMADSIEEMRRDRARNQLQMEAMMIVGALSSPAALAALPEGWLGYMGAQGIAAMNATKNTVQASTHAAKEYAKRNASDLCKAGGLAVAICNAGVVKPNPNLLGTADDLASGIRQISTIRRTSQQAKEVDKIIRQTPRLIKK
ncbi:MAG: hypothetical protein HWE16_02590 [Gammaproteobacteria bacterium]|nr:hypothetical protein [Gammaproteobacteria bacterium]